MRSHVLKFPTKAIKLHAVEILSSVVTMLDAFILEYFLFVLTARTLNAPSLNCLAVT